MLAERDNSDAWQPAILAGTDMLLQAAYSADNSAAAAKPAADVEAPPAELSKDPEKEPKKRARKERVAGSERLKGVFSCKNSAKYKAQVQIDKKPNYLGLYNTREEAGQAYDNYIIGEHGMRAKTNYMYSDAYVESIYKKRRAGSGSEEALASTPSSAAKSMDLIYPGDTIALLATVNTGGEISVGGLCDKLIDLSRIEVASNITTLHKSILEVEPVGLYWKRQFFMWKGTLLNDPDKGELTWRGNWLASFFEPSLGQVSQSKNWFDYRHQPAPGAQAETREIAHRSIPNTYFVPVSGLFTGSYASVDEDSGSSVEFSDQSLVLEFKQFDKPGGADFFGDDSAALNRQIDVDFPLFCVSGRGVDCDGNCFIVTGTYNSYTQFLEMRRNYSYVVGTRGTSFEKDGVRYSSESAPVIVDQSMISEDELESGSEDEARAPTARGTGGTDVFRAPLATLAPLHPEDSNSRSRWDV